MARFKAIKIAALLTALVVSTNAYAGSVVIGGVTLKSYDEISDYYYGILGSQMSNAVTSRTLGKLDLNKLDGKFAFISPSVEKWKDRYSWVDGWLFTPSADTQLMLGYTEQIKAEMLFYQFEKMGLVDQLDVVSEDGLTKEVERNYDYVVTMRSDFNGKRDPKSVNARKTEYIVHNLKTGKEQKIAETTGSAVLLGLFETVAVKFSDAVKSTN